MNSSIAFSLILTAGAYNLDLDAALWIIPVVIGYCESDCDCYRLTRWHLEVSNKESVESIRAWLYRA